MLIKRITALSTALIFTSGVNAMTMQDLFEAVNAEANVTSPAALQGQTMNLYAGGSLFMRTPKKTYDIATITPPNWSAGCGGIDLYMGGFSYINKDQFVAMLKNIGSNALGYGFKLAIQNLCPTCDNVMQALEATARAVNKMNVDSCEAAKGIVNASIPATWEKGRQNAAKNFGVDTNFFEDITDAWTNVMNDQKKSNEALDAAATAKPEIKDQLPTGNVVWKALKKVNGIDDKYRMILMSLIGTTIFPTDPSATNKSPLVLQPLDLSVETLIGKSHTKPELDFLIYHCGTDLSSDGCLEPTVQSIETIGPVLSFRHMVRQRLAQITDTISTRSEYADKDATFAFLSVTDLPVYKMIAIATSLDNTAMADTLMDRYQDLIAAKYADVYIQAATKDLGAAISKYAGSATDPSVAKELEKTIPQLDKLRTNARIVMQNAYTQTISTYNIAQEVNYMERALNANLSQALRSSMAFGKSMR